jgi:hypothetical protein
MFSFSFDPEEHQGVGEEVVRADIAEDSLGRVALGLACILL